MQITFFRTPKPKQFNYKPRYYDEEKERQEQRRKELMGDGQGNTINIRRQIERRWRKEDRQNRDKSRRMNVLVYILVAVILIYFIFFV